MEYCTNCNQDDQLKEKPEKVLETSSILGIINGLVIFWYNLFDDPGETYSYSYESLYYTYFKKSSQSYLFSNLSGTTAGVKTNKSNKPNMCECQLDAKNQIQ